jgi:hypothetical protein
MMLGKEVGFYCPSLFQNQIILESNPLIKNDSVAVADECKLSDAYLLLIFEKMSTKEIVTTVSLVCKRWHTLSRSPVLWKNLCLNQTHFDKNSIKQLNRVDCFDLFVKYCKLLSSGLMEFTINNVEISSSKNKGKQSLSTGWQIYNGLTDDEKNLFFYFQIS